MLTSDDKSKIDGLVADVALEDLLNGLVTSMLTYADRIEKFGEHGMAAEHRKAALKIQNIAKEVFGLICEEPKAINLLDKRVALLERSLRDIYFSRATGVVVAIIKTDGKASYGFHIDKEYVAQMMGLLGGIINDIQFSHQDQELFHQDPPQEHSTCYNPSVK